MGQPGSRSSRFGVWLLGSSALLFIALALAGPGHAQIELPGTQPEELTEAIRDPELCANCHGGYDDDAAWDTWSGTMMANASRDPLFLAALTVANQDVPGAGDLCIRCHSPGGWLAGRSEPSDGSALIELDRESVSCDFCHRIMPGPDGEVLVGNGQFFIGDDAIRRGPIEEPQAPHETEYSPLFEQSELCAICHDVSNPLEGGFAIERTYTEWFQSDFAEEGTTCQSCHLPAVEAPACGAPGMPTRTIHRHEFAGGNAWMPGVIAALYPELGREEAYARTIENARRMLRSAAAVTLEDVPDELTAGDTLAFTVRVENLTGHKLPTGYPEGRQCWLQVEITDADGERIWISGDYDYETGERHADEQLRTYEVKMAADGREGFHFILQDELLQDNRIPPRGFVPSDEQTRPVGRDYPTLPSGALAHWDEAPYAVNLPANTRGPVRIRATLLYQSTSGEYVRFLRDENQTDDRGEQMYALWEAHDRSRPVDMATVEAVVAVRPAPEEGCRQAPGERASIPAWWLGIVAAMGAIAFGRRR